MSLQLHVLQVLYIAGLPGFVFLDLFLQLHLLHYRHLHGLGILGLQLLDPAPQLIDCYFEELGLLANLAGSPRLLLEQLQLALVIVEGVLEVLDLVLVFLVGSDVLALPHLEPINLRFLLAEFVLEGLPISGGALELLSQLFEVLDYFLIALQLEFPLNLGGLGEGRTDAVCVVGRGE